MGEGRVWDLGAQTIFSALRLKILMPGAKNRRQALRSHTPALSLPGEGVKLFASAFALPSEKIDTLTECGRGDGKVSALIRDIFISKPCYARCSAATARSISLIPIHVTITPPSP